MALRDGIAKLDDFLKLSDRELLAHAGAIFRDEARAKTESPAQQKKGAGMIGEHKRRARLRPSPRIPPTGAG